MPDALRAAFLFLINTLFDLYIFILVIRAILVYVRSNYFEPVTQLIIKLTDFIVKPLRRYVPNFYNIESASVLLIVVLETIKFLFIALLSFGWPTIIGLLILALADSIKMVLITFFYAILLQALLSWLQPSAPIHRILSQFNAPIMRPFQRWIPPVGGFDVSPIPALILLQLLIIVIVNPMMAFGFGVALG